VCPKQFQCLRYVRCNACTYLCTDANTVSKQTKTKFHTTHVTYEFHRVRPKLFMSLWYIKCKPCTYLVSRLALSPNGTNRARPGPRHLGVPSGVSKTIYEPMVHLTQTEHHLSRLALSANGPNSAPPDPHHLGVTSGVSKTIYEPMVHLTQTEHLSCTDTNPISKQIETRFHMTHLT
jgi:hypothetical protein